MERNHILPHDLTYPLALQRPWKELEMTYNRLPEYEELALDSNHEVWSNLYRYYLSTYPLPDDTNYREQFFRGMHLVESPYNNNPLRKLAELGYDVAFQKRYNELKKAVTSRQLTDALTAAARHGYLTIVQFLVPSIIPAKWASAYIMSSILWGQVEILHYLLSLNLPLDEHPLVLNELRQGIVLAAEKGQRDMVWYIADILPDVDYCELRDVSLWSNNTLLTNELSDHCDEPLSHDDVQLIRDSNRSVGRI